MSPSSEAGIRGNFFHRQKRQLGICRTDRTALQQFRPSAEQKLRERLLGGVNCLLVGFLGGNKRPRSWRTYRIRIRIGREN